MHIDELDFDLPPGLIAQTPPETREAARLLALDRRTGARRHLAIPDLPSELRARDLLVVNDTRVLPARVMARRSTGGRVEVLFLEPAAEPSRSWHALLRAGGRPAPGERLEVAPGWGIRLADRAPDGSWTVEPEGGTGEALMEACGIMPLPPYIRRTPDDERAAEDRVRYQTVYAREPGAVAAPTAGLHLSDALLAKLADRGVGRASVTLHVGRGTFEPVRVDDLDAHPMHVERYGIPSETREAVAATRDAGGRVIAIGTTSVRALEAAAAETDDGLPVVGWAATDLLIQPGYRFRVVDGLLTNFHLPRSTLLALVYALAGTDATRAAYTSAISRRYRFFSYGDAMFIA